MISLEDNRYQHGKLEESNPDNFLHFFVGKNLTVRQWQFDDRNVTTSVTIRQLLTIIRIVAIDAPFKFKRTIQHVEFNSSSYSSDV